MEFDVLVVYSSRNNLSGGGYYEATVLEIPRGWYWIGSAIHVSRQGGRGEL